MVDSIIQDVSKRRRNLGCSKRDKKPPNEVMWVQTFGPATPHIQEAVKEANTMLPNSPAWPADQKIIGVVNKKSKSLGDLILRRKHLALKTNFDSPGTTRCSPLPTPDLKRIVGRPCECCGLVSGNYTITYSSNGKLYKTPSADCK